MITAVRNPRYYEAHIVGVDELVFPIVVDGNTMVSLYKHGAVAAMPGPSFPPLFTPILSGKKDFRRAPAFATVFPAMNVEMPPFDNVLLRYALNMGTEKKAITDFLGAGRVPALAWCRRCRAIPRRTISTWRSMADSLMSLRSISRRHVAAGKSRFRFGLQTR